MEHSKKGLKGFQKKPDYLKKTERYSFKLTKSELNTINSYCESKGITKADLFREALNDFYKKVGITIEQKELNNPNQLRID